MTENRYDGTRMTGMDQIVWNLTGDEDLFCIWGIARLEEPLHDDLIEKAFRWLIWSVPVLNSRPVTNAMKGRWRFMERENVSDLIQRIHASTDAAAEDSLKALFQNPVNARQNAMLRVISIDGPGVHYLVIQVHHLVMDGEGLKRICVRFAEIYKALSQNPDWKPVERFDPCRSWGQIAKNFRVKHLWLVLKAYLINMYDMIVSILRKHDAYQLIRDAQGSQPTHDPLGTYFESVVIERDKMLALKAFAKRRQVTVNDILMTSLGLATLKWNQDRGDDRDWLRFGYTANLRRWWGEPGGTFGNYSVVLMHEEETANLQTPDIALSTVKAKVDKVKKRIGLDAFLILMQMKLIPYAFIRRFTLKIKPKLLDWLSRCHAMTNIGIIFEEAGDFGHTRAAGYSFLAPTFPGGLMTYTVTTYQNVTTIHLACSQDVFSEESARRFLGLWRQKMLDVIQQ